MNKAELVLEVAKRAKVTHRLAKVVVETVFKEMNNALQGGERVEIRGFGSFAIRKYNSYQGRNPKTGQTVHVPPKRLPYFKVGKELKERIDLKE